MRKLPSILGASLAIVVLACGSSGSGTSTKTYAISGTVSGAIASGVTVTLHQTGTSESPTATTGSSGTYSFSGLAAATYTVTPSLGGYSFDPTNRRVTIDAGDVAGQDFTSAVLTIPAAPANLVATPGDGQVSLTWNAVPLAGSYNVYYSTAAGVTKSSTAGPAGVATTAATVTGLTDGTPYFFAVTALNATGEGDVSNEATATPAAAAGITGADLVGAWRFAALSAGASSGWQRGTLTVAADGTVTVSSFLDDLGATAAPAEFPGHLYTDAAGHLRDAAALGSALFTGELGPTKKNVIVLTASSSGIHSLAILLKHDPATTFLAGSGGGTDIAGWGGGTTGGGPRKVIYDQISSGVSPQEWEFAAGQIGSTPQIQYASSSGGAVPMPYVAPSSPTRPTNKNTSLAIDAAGVVSETVSGGSSQTQPTFLLTQGFMSDDKTLIVGVGLQPSPQGATAGATGRHVLRVYHVTNVNSSNTQKDATTGAQSELAGSYGFRRLAVGTSALTASGTLTVDAGGAASFSSYSDSASGLKPADFSFTMLPQDMNVSGTEIDQFWGALADGSDPSLNGKLAYYKDLFVFTRTESAGQYSFTIALK